MILVFCLKKHTLCLTNLLKLEHWTFGHRQTQALLMRYNIINYMYIMIIFFVRSSFIGFDQLTGAFFISSLYDAQNFPIGFKFTSSVIVSDDQNSKYPNYVSVLEYSNMSLLVVSLSHPGFIDFKILLSFKSFQYL